MIRYARWCSLLLLAGINATTLLAEPEYEDSRNLKQSFAIDEHSYVEISNKYGDVEIRTWEVDSVKFEVSIVVKSDDHSNLREMISMIDVEFTAATGFIIAETIWAEDLGFFKKQLYQLGQSFGSDDRIEVSYIVHLPENIPMEINNQFGNIFIGDYSGDLEIELAHGDFRARNLARVKQLRVRYGKIKIHEAESVRLDANYVGSAEIDEVDELYIKSTASEIEVERVRFVQINSRHDEIVLDEVVEINGYTSLTDLDIGMLVDRMDVTSKFGSVNITEVGERAQLINLSGSSTDYRLGFSPFFSSGFEVEVTEMGQFTYSEEVFVGNGKSGEKAVSYIGWVGSESDVKVKVYTKGGYVKFDHQ